MTFCPLSQVVTGAVNAPSGGAQAPPGGVAMQFPASNDATDDAGVEEGEGDEEQLTDEEKKIKAEAEEQKRLKRELDRTKARTYRIRSRMSELRRWIKTQSKEVLTSVTAQTAKLDTRIQAVPGVVGPIGARGKAGSPGKNGLNGAHGAAGGPGPDGEPGEPGTQGEAGPTGPPGVVGIEGEEGPIGKPFHFFACLDLFRRVSVVLLWRFLWPYCSRWPSCVFLRGCMGPLSLSLPLPATSRRAFKTGADTLIIFCVSFRVRRLPLC